MTNKTISKIIVCILCAAILAALIIFAKKESTTSRIQKTSNSVEKVLQLQTNNGLEEISYEPNSLGTTPPHVVRRVWNFI